MRKQQQALFTAGRRKAGWSLWDPGSYARRTWPTAAMAGTRQHRQLRNWWSFPSFFNGCHFGSHWTKDTKSTSFVACLGCLYVKTARMLVQIFRSLHACMRFIIVRQCCTVHFRAFRADPRNAHFPLITLSIGVMNEMNGATGGLLPLVRLGWCVNRNSHTPASKGFIRGSSACHGSNLISVPCIFLVRQYVHTVIQKYSNEAQTYTAVSCIYRFYSSRTLCIAKVPAKTCSDSEVVCWRLQQLQWMVGKKLDHQLTSNVSKQRLHTVYATFMDVYIDQ